MECQGLKALWDVTPAKFALEPLAEDETRVGHTGYPPLQGEGRCIWSLTDIVDFRGPTWV